MLEKNTLHRRTTTDIATKSGRFDIMTIGMFEVAMWEQNGWLSPPDTVPAENEPDDVLKSVRDGLISNGKLFALPFYAESQMTFYRKDLFEMAGVGMPEQPTWSQFSEPAAKVHDSANGADGICLRGKPGWGENVGKTTPAASSYGARWFDMNRVSEEVSGLGSRAGRPGFLPVLLKPRDCPCTWRNTSSMDKRLSSPGAAAV